MSKVLGMASSSLEAGTGRAYVTRDVRAMEQHMPAAYLSDRGVVKVTGPEAKAFLDGIVTCDLDRITAGAARLGALLSPQGKILFDFIVFEAPEDAGGGYYLDVLKPYAPDLARRLGFYKLRAKVVIDDR